MKVALALHGLESSSKGGPSTRVPRLASNLAQFEMETVLGDAAELDFGDADLAHIFNVWPPDSALEAVRRARQAGASVVLSPIFLDLRTRPLWHEVKRIIGSSDDDGEIALQLLELKDRAQAMVDTDILLSEEMSFEYINQVAHLAASATGIIYLSKHERALMESALGRPCPGELVRNAVPVESYIESTPSLFEQKFGLSDYILNVGRIEERKNQLALVYALRGLGRPIVLVGSCVDDSYLAEIRRVGGENVHVLGRIDDPVLLASAYSGASCFALPSWCEGAPLAALEAAAAGTPLVLSDQSAEREYFGDFAQYVHPVDVVEIRKAVEIACSEKRDRRSLRDFTKANFAFDRHVHETAKVYRQISQGRGQEVIRNIPVYLTGSVCKFRTDGDNSVDCELHWREGNVGQFRLFRNQPGELIAYFQCFVAGETTVHVQMNSQYLGTMCFTERGVSVREFALGHMLSGDVCEFEFRALGDRPDDFSLLAFAAVETAWPAPRRMEALSAFDLGRLRSGETARINSAGSGASLLDHGWYAPEADRTWSEEHAKLRFEVVGEPSRMTLELTFDVLISQDVRFLVSGAEPNWVPATAGQANTVRLPLHGKDLVRGICEVSIHAPKASSPASLGMGADVRSLGIALFSAGVTQTVSPTNSRLSEIWKNLRLPSVLGRRA